MTEHALEIELVVDDDLEPLERAVTVVIPAYNEAAHVADQVTSVDRVMSTSGWDSRCVAAISAAASLRH